MVFLAGALFHSFPAHADVIFDFNGVCDFGCTGTATGILTLADSYAFGSDITTANFISFDYSSSHLSFDIPSADAPSLEGGLNADGSFNSEEPLVIQANAGLPVFGASPGRFTSVMTDVHNEDLGSTFTFTLVSGAVPEPSTWAMMLLGFAGLSFAGYRKAKRAAVARA
jgi:PEP-CTERM motif